MCVILLVLVIKIQGVKIVNKTNLIKKLAALTLLVSGALTLAACGDKSLSTPYGTLDDTVYLSGDGYSITEKELYEEMRLSSSSVLVEMIEKELFKDELALVNAAPETYAEDLLKYANEAIFGTSDKEALESMDENTKTQKVLSFIDSFYLVNIEITEADIDTENFEAHDQKVLDYYKLTVAKKIYAKEILAEEVKDKENASYIDVDKALQTYFAANVQNNYDMSAITIRFVNQNEANATLRRYNIKAYRSQWYELADPRTTVVTDYAATVLADLGIANTGSISEADYVKYYDKYSINPNREPISDADVPMTLDETLVKFLEIYNYIYSYKDQVSTTYTVDTILTDLVNLPFTKSYEDFTNTSLRTYIYNTLGTGETDTRFTSSPRLNGSYYYLAFKLEAHNEEVLNWMDEDDKFIVYTETGELTEKALEIYDLVEESKLTSSYISSKATERFNDAEVVVYDELVKLYLGQNYSNVKLSSKSSKTVVAKVGDKEITVDELYAELEAKLGVSVAIDIAIRETLKASDYMDDITAEKRAEFRDNIETIITQFGQDYYASSGYPASMGRKNFLMLAFRATSIDEAVENVYVASALEDAYLADIEAHYGEGIYQTLADYANKLQAQYFSLTASHALIFIDMNEDDRPDDPAEYFDTLTVVEQDALKALVTELMQVVYDRATTYSSFSTGLTAIVDEFKTSGRIAPASCNVAPFDQTPECRWAEYKAAGLNLMFESLSAITNSTNTIGSTSKLDENFYDRAVEIYTEVKAEYYDVDNKFPSQYLDVRPADYADVLESSFGWHLILATGGQTFTSAKFGTADDTKKEETDEYFIYQHIEYEDEAGEKYYLDAYSIDDTISANQVRIYLNEVDSEYGVQNLPTKVSSAISAYFAPIYTKYTGNYNQLNLLYKLLADTNYNFAAAGNNAKAERLVEINQDQFFSYEFNNDLFNDVYGDWWTTF